MTSAELRKRRVAFGLNVSRFARLLGESAGAVYTWDRGYSPVPDRIEAKLAAIEETRWPTPTRMPPPPAVDPNPPVAVPQRLMGTELREIRWARGLPQRAFAQQLGVSQHTLSMWETGRRHVPDNLTARIAALDEGQGSEGDEG